jgi:hypothetical protein
MELAVAAGFDVRVVALPPGLDPADAVDGFEERLAEASGYVLHRVRLEIANARDRQEAFVRVREVLANAAAGPEQLEALRYAADRLDLPPDVQAGLVPRGSTRTGQVSRKVLDAGERLERRLLAVCASAPELAERYLKPLDDRHFDSERNKRIRAYLVGELEPDDELLAARAELDALAAEEELPEESARELFLRLEERVVRRELAELGGEDIERTVELQTVLAKIRSALQEAAT